MSKMKTIKPGKLKGGPRSGTGVDGKRNDFMVKFPQDGPNKFWSGDLPRHSAKKGR